MRFPKGKEHPNTWATIEGIENTVRRDSASSDHVKKHSRMAVPSHPMQHHHVRPQIRKSSAKAMKIRP